MAAVRPRFSQEEESSAQAHFTCFRCVFFFVKSLKSYETKFLMKWIKIPDCNVPCKPENIQHSTQIYQILWWQDSFAPQFMSPIWHRSTKSIFNLHLNRSTRVEIEYTLCWSICCRKVGRFAWLNQMNRFSASWEISIYEIREFGYSGRYFYHYIQ